MFIVGCEEGIFPSGRALESATEMEEERRCMYVAITRAQERLWLTSAGVRFRFGELKNSIVSRFVEEAGLIKKEPAKFEPLKPSQYENLTKARPIASFANQRPVGGDANNIRANVQKDISIFKIGSIVCHSRYGEGEIISLNGDTATIHFTKLGNKNFNLRIAPIELKE